MPPPLLLLLPTVPERLAAGYPTATLKTLFADAISALRATTGVSDDAVISSPNRVDTQLRHESSDPPPLTLDAMIADGATISSLRAVQARLADGDLAALAAADVPRLAAVIASWEREREKQHPSGLCSGSRGEPQVTPEPTDFGPAQLSGQAVREREQGLQHPSGLCSGSLGVPKATPQPADADPAQLASDPQLNDPMRSSPFSTPRKTGNRGALLHDEASARGPGPQSPAQPASDGAPTALTIQTLAVLLDAVRKPVIPESDSASRKRGFTQAFDGLNPAEQQRVRAAAEGRTGHDFQRTARQSVDDGIKYFGHEQACFAYFPNGNPTIDTGALYDGEISVELNDKREALLKRLAPRLLGKAVITDMISGLASLDPEDPANSYLFEDDEERPAKFPCTTARLRGQGELVYRHADVPAFSAAQNKSLQSFEEHAEHLRVFSRVEAARRQAGEDNLRRVLRDELDAGRLSKNVFAEFEAQSEVTSQFVQLSAAVQLGLATFPRGYQAPKPPDGPSSSTFGVQSDENARLIKSLGKKVDGIRSTWGGAGRQQTRGGPNGQQQSWRRQRPSPKKQQPQPDPRAKKAADMGSATGHGAGPGSGGGRGRQENSRGRGRSATHGRGRGRGRRGGR